MTAIIGACDRTGEFRACAKSYQQQIVSGRLYVKPRKSLPTRVGRFTSTFLNAARDLSTDLQLTQTKLKKLLILLDEKSTDAVSLSKLIQVIQCDIIDMNKAASNLKDLEVKTRSELSFRSQSLKHNRLIVGGIEYRLAFLVNRFQQALEKNKDIIFRDSFPTGQQADGTPLLSPESSNANTKHEFIACPGTYENSLDSHLSYNNSPKSNDLPNNLQSTNISLLSHQSTHHSIPHIATSRKTFSPIPPESSVQMSLGPVCQPQQGQLSTFMDQEVRQRDANLKRVESTIIQLGEIYQQFSTLVQEQGEMVTRIDSYTDDTELNISSAHEHLLNYLRGVTSRRAFMIKVFVTLLICFAVFAWLRR